MEVLSSEINMSHTGKGEEPKGQVVPQQHTHTHTFVAALSYNAWGIPACGNHGNQVRPQTDAI